MQFKNLEFKNLMIDLETFSTRQDAAIATIGAVFFDIQSGQIGDRFYRGVVMAEQYGYGDINAEDVKFWLRQQKAAQDEIIRMTDPVKGAHLLIDVLRDFSTFLHQSPYQDEIKIWGNGAGFDPVVLESAYRRCKSYAPWNFRMVRDVRTMVDLGRDLLGIYPKVDMPFEGMPHNALDDAIHQAKYVSAIYQQLQHCVAARA
jgi:hypothetical protein